MKTTINKNFIKVLSAFRVNAANFVIWASVKRGRPLIRVLACLLPIVGSSTTSAKIRTIVVFTRQVFQLIKHNGAKGLCLTLKVYAVTLQQAVGGHRVKDLTELKFRVSRTNKGIPRIIPRVHRDMISKGDISTIKLWLSLFNLYRVIDFHGDTRVASLVKTIVTPGVPTETIRPLYEDLLGFVPEFYKRLTGMTKVSPKTLWEKLIEEYGMAQPFPLLKSSPFTLPLSKFSEMTRKEQTEAMALQPVVSSHPFAVHEAANALENNAELRDCVRYFLLLCPEGHVLRNIYTKCIHLPIGTAERTQKGKPYLGRLSTKVEAAGKVRVFAMVDIWTQWLMKPLHDTIFDNILFPLPQDGTRDQLAPIHKLLGSDPNCLFSYDLSAATDRLPVWLSKAILAGFTGQEYAQNWANFLTNRSYLLQVLDRFRHPIRVFVRYATGQPMGALSSWANLALTHHFIVQFCA